MNTRKYCKFESPKRNGPVLRVQEIYQVQIFFLFLEYENKSTFVRRFSFFFRIVSGDHFDPGTVVFIIRTVSYLKIVKKIMLYAFYEV